MGSRRGARVVEWDGLENRCTGNRTVGSNPTLSANFKTLKSVGLRPIANPLQTFWAALGLAEGLTAPRERI
jgi:hypothetical protein